LSEAPDSPFLNRVTQGLAQPGTLLQPFILSSAWQRNPDLAPGEPISRSVPLNGIYVTCRDVPAETTWQGALEMACPYPFVELARDMELTGLFDSFANWGFLDAPTFTLPTVAAEAPPEDLIDEALGQGNLLVTPLQMVGATAALGNDGVRPNLHLLAQPLAGCDEPLPGSEELVVSPEVAEEIRRALPQFDAAVGHLGISLAGPDRKQAWFVGLNSPDLPRYAVAVLIDQSLRAEDAADIGTQLLQRVLEN
jgi:cell division protein FtsI/penicillin-binding protein 2